MPTTQHQAILLGAIAEFGSAAKEYDDAGQRAIQTATNETAEAVEELISDRTDVLKATVRKNFEQPDAFMDGVETILDVALTRATVDYYLASTTGNRDAAECAAAVRYLIGNLRASRNVVKHYALEAVIEEFDKRVGQALSDVSAEGAAA